MRFTAYLICFVFCAELFGQLGFSWNPSTNDATAFVKFDNISYRNKLEFDQDYCLCSSKYKVKISQTWYDSMPGLEMGKFYYVRISESNSAGATLFSGSRLVFNLTASTPPLI